MALVHAQAGRIDLPAIAALAILAETPRHPYEVSRLLQSRGLAGSGAYSGRALYRAVDRLREAGLVEVAETSRDGHRPERTVYRITDEGREELRYALCDLLANPELGSAAFAAAVGRLGYLSEADVVPALEIRLAHLEGLVAHQEATVRSLRQHYGLPRLFLLDDEYSLGQLRAETSWVREAIDAVRSGELAVHREWVPGADQVEETLSLSDLPPERVPLALRRWERSPALAGGTPARSRPAPDQASSAERPEGGAA